LPLAATEVMVLGDVGADRMTVVSSSGGHGDTQ
jgi:hypothetical protein